MAYTTKLDMGYPISLVQNQVYALPAMKVTAQVTQDCTVANDTGFSVVTTVTATGGPQVISAAFLKCAATNGIVTLKRD